MARDRDRERERKSNGDEVDWIVFEHGGRFHKMRRNHYRSLVTETLIRYSVPSQWRTSHPFRFYPIPSQSKPSNPISTLYPFHRKASPPKLMLTSVSTDPNPMTGQSLPLTITYLPPLNISPFLVNHIVLLSKSIPQPTVSPAPYVGFSGWSKWSPCS